MRTIELKNERLAITITVCDANECDTQRFDRACRVKDIVLDGEHSLAVKEQYIESRRSTNGYGLSTEWVLPGYAEKALAGQYFYKPGVGLLKQIKDNAPYDIWTTYECIPQELEVTEPKTASNAVTFLEKSSASCPLEIKRTLELIDNTIKITTNICNKGSDHISLSEYQHNFFAIDNMPIGPGYNLYCPYIKDLKGVEWESSKIDVIGAACGEHPMPLNIDTHTITWAKPMKQNAYYVSFPGSEVSDTDGSESYYKWTISHDSNDRKISESMDFKPARQDLWGVEHCICSEAFKGISLDPGESDCYTRIWTFE